MDDDIWLNILLLSQYLSSPLTALAGHVKDTVFNLQPIRSATDNSRKVERFNLNLYPNHIPYFQWLIPLWMYPDTLFPSYTMGSFYIIPSTHLACLVSSTARVPLLSVEDVYVTGLLRRQCGVQLQDVPRR